MKRYMLVKDALAQLPVKVSERRFRTAALKTGKHRLSGRQMMVTPEDVDAILEEMTRSTSIGAKKVHLGRSAGRSSPHLQVNASAKALALLTRMQRRRKGSRS